MSDLAPPLPAAACIRRDGAGVLYIEALRCRRCEAVTVQPRLACPRCGSREGFDAFQASSSGRLHAYSIVRRSFPAVKTPFISAVIDLDDGVVLKGNLVDIDPDPAAIFYGLPVEVVFADALGRTDAAGRAHVAYFFKPRRV